MLWPLEISHYTFIYLLWLNSFLDNWFLSKIALISYVVFFLETPLATLQLKEAAFLLTPDIDHSPINTTNRLLQKVINEYHWYDAVEMGKNIVNACNRVLLLCHNYAKIILSNWFTTEFNCELVSPYYNPKFFSLGFFLFIPPYLIWMNISEWIKFINENNSYWYRETFSLYFPLFLSNGKLIWILN